jgi:hypothetical protein
MIAAHCMLTLTLVFNPLNQETEELFRVPQGKFFRVNFKHIYFLEFGIKRVWIRSGMMVAVIFVAESVPNFGPVLNLMGASTVTLTCIVFPCIFYLFLRVREEKIIQFGGDIDDDPPTLSE